MGHAAPTSPDQNKQINSEEKIQERNSTQVVQD